MVKTDRVGTDHQAKWVINTGTNDTMVSGPALTGTDHSTSQMGNTSTGILAAQWYQYRH